MYNRKILNNMLRRLCALTATLSNNPKQENTYSRHLEGLEHTLALRGVHQQLVQLVRWQGYTRNLQHGISAVHTGLLCCVLGGGSSSTAMCSWRQRLAMDSVQR